jgi:hypothetical protein
MGFSLLEQLISISTFVECIFDDLEKCVSKFNLVFFFFKKKKTNLGGLQFKVNVILNARIKTCSFTPEKRKRKRKRIYISLYNYILKRERVSKNM